MSDSADKIAGIIPTVVMAGVAMKMTNSLFGKQKKISRVSQRRNRRIRHSSNTRGRFKSPL